MNHPSPGDAQTPGDLVSGASGADLADRYIPLLRDAVTGTLWNAGDGTLWRPRRSLRPLHRWLGRRGFVVSRRVSVDGRDRGRDWPQLAHTMIGRQRLDNLRACIDSVLDDDVPGDLIETGVWRGGACIFMRGVLAARGVRDRCVWLADSFAGLPEPDAIRFPADLGDRHHRQSDLAVSVDEVRVNFERFGLLDGQVRFLPGWFEDTLASAPIDQLAVLRLDGDMYSSTITALSALYPRLSSGGYCIVDDYGAIESCRRAVHDYRAEHGISSPIEDIDGEGAYWRA